MQNEHDSDDVGLSDEQMASTVFRLVETIVELIEIAKVSREPYQQLIDASERVHRQILVGPTPEEHAAACEFLRNNIEFATEQHLSGGAN